MMYVKLQVGCLIVVLYIVFIYFKECRKFRREHKKPLFECLLLCSVISLITDGLTAYTVNHLDAVDSILNRVLHMIFLSSIDCVIFIVFLYMMHTIGKYPKRRKGKMLIWIPFLLSILTVILFTPTLQYRQGEISNYSMGMSAYTCFFMAGVYLMLTLVNLFRGWHNIESHKRTSILTCLLVFLCVTAYQAIVPQALVTSIGTMVMVLGVYINLENPAIEELSVYHKEMVMGFATLVENKDDSTGGHVRRTTRYVQLLMEELRDRGCYKDILTKDYMKNMMMAAPMHDIGKISIPDAILQKPGKLTAEEFAIMKQHTVSGGRIIQDTFGNLGNEQYREMAYQVAMYHHEKWNGKGYPQGLKQSEIPLCARIMAIADVFDAVSENRCYRAAMPMDKCFEIIQKGSGEDFEPLLAEVFLDIRQRVEMVHKEVGRFSVR